LDTVVSPTGRIRRLSESKNPRRAEKGATRRQIQLLRYAENLQHDDYEGMPEEVRARAAGELAVNVAKEAYPVRIQLKQEA